MNTPFEQPSDLQTEALDLATLQQSKTACNEQMINIEVFHTQTAYLPALYNRFNRSNALLNQANIRLRDATQKMHLELNSSNQTLRGFLAELTQSVDDDERLEILGDAARVLDTALKTTRQETSLMASSLLAVSEAFDRTATLRNLAGFNAEQERLPDEILQIEASRTKVEDERATLTDAINAIQSKGFGAIAQDTLLTAEKVVAMGPTPPQLAVIELALDLLKQSLEKMDIALNFLGLISLRDALRERSNELSAALRAKQVELDLVNRRIDLIQATHTFDDHLQDYKREFAKVVSSVRAYEIRYNRMSSLDEARVSAFIADSAVLADYLRPIR